MAIRSEPDENLRESCLRFIGQICYENTTIVEEDIFKQIYRQAEIIAFLPESVFEHHKSMKDSAK